MAPSIHKIQGLFWPQSGTETNHLAICIWNHVKNRLFQQQKR